MNSDFSPLKNIRELLNGFYELPDENKEELLDALDTVIDNYSEKNSSEKETLPFLPKPVFIQLTKIKKYADYISRQESSNKGMANIQNGLLIIIGNIKHYLGDSWKTIFPNGMEATDAFLEKIDKRKVLKTNTWSRYEKRENETKSVPSSFFNASGNDDDMF